MHPESIVDICASRVGWDAAGLERDFQSLLRAHGRILLASRQEFGRLMEILKDPGLLSAGEQARWTALLGSLRTDGRMALLDPTAPEGIDEFGRLQHIENTVDHLRAAAVISRDSFAALAPEAVRGDTTTEGGLGVAIASAASDLAAFASAQAHSGRLTFSGGTARDDVWKALFAPVASHSRRVVVHDRYLLKALVNHHRSHDSSVEHLVWFLRRLDGAAQPGTRVKLYAAAELVGFCTNAAEVKEALDTRWPNRSGKLEAIELHLIDHARDQHHDRHIRFGESIGFDLPAGMDRLSKPSLDIDSGFSYHHLWSSGAIADLRNRETLTISKGPLVIAL